MPEKFLLHPTLSADSLPVITLALCEVRLMNNALYPWLLLIPQIAGLKELYELSPLDQAQLCAEITLCSQALKKSAPCEKLNIAMLGNKVSQLHVHLVARTSKDARWPEPVFGGPSKPYEKLQAAEWIALFISFLDQN